MLLDSQRRDSATKELLARHEAEIEERNDTIRRLQSELDRVNNKLGQVKELRRRLTDEQALTERRPEEAAESELTQFRLELGQVREERSRLTFELDRTRRQLTESEEQTRCVTQELNCVRSELSEVTGELRDLDHRMTDSLLQQQELAEAKRRSDELCQTLSTDLEDLKVKLADVVGQLEVTQRSKEDLENQLTA